jgi:hypothetical protein
MEKVNMVEIYIRPTEDPDTVLKDTDVRLYYAGKWIDFRDNTMVIRNDAGDTLKIIK